MIRCGLVFGVLGRIFARVIGNDDELSTVGRSTGFHCYIHICIETQIFHFHLAC